MKKVGIICEYNPFHNGHIYHLQKIKENFPDSMIILIMSSSFTMRGEISLLTKWDKTYLALLYGVSLVVELPTFYSTNSADIFAKGALYILNQLRCDYLVFGSECNDINLLTEYARCQLDNKEYDLKVKEYMDKGLNYPTSMSKTLEDLTGHIINSPNDLLGLSYVKEILKENYSIKPVTIKRTNNYHEEEIMSNISSATSIRNALLNKEDISLAIPKETNERIIKDNVQEKYFSLLKYKILSDVNNLNEYLDVSEGLDNLIKKNIIKTHNYQELISLIKTKRYTYNRLNRMFNHILLNIKKLDIDNRSTIDYIRVLGFDSLGKKYLKEIRNYTTIPIITNYSDINSLNLSFELYVTMIYLEIINKPNLIIQELKSIPIEKESD